MPHGSHMAARSNPAGCTTDGEKSFCCVTTRRQGETFRPPETCRPVAAWELAGGDLVPPRRASDGHPAPPAALAAASLLASDARPAGKRGPDSIAGSTVVPDRAVHSLWQGKFANPAVPLWSNHPHRCYAVNDPWEVLLPWGSLGRMFAHPPRALIPWCFVPSSIARWRRLPSRHAPRPRARDTQEGGYDAPH